MAFFLNNFDNLGPEFFEFILVGKRDLLLDSILYFLNCGNAFAYKFNYFIQSPVIVIALFPFWHLFYKWNEQKVHNFN